jgi:hypothetical protein
MAVLPICKAFLSAACHIIIMWLCRKEWCILFFGILDFILKVTTSFGIFKSERRTAINLIDLLMLAPQRENHRA